MNIAALARRTGVAPDTLRKWEQRYGVLRPTRTRGGQRRYDERDVARVLWLRTRLDEGYRIGEAAALLGTMRESATTPAEQLEGLLVAADASDAARLALVLDQAFALNPVMRALTTVVEPLLHEVGARWERGELSIAQEHLVTEAVRSRLGHLLGDPGGGVRGTAVLACAPGERHELGLMMTAIALRDDGWQVVYLGSDTPAGEAVALAGAIRARFVGFSISRAEPASALEPELAHRDDPVEVVLGGAGATDMLAHQVRGRRVGGDLAGSVRALRAFAP